MTTPQRHRRSPRNKVSWENGDKKISVEFGGKKQPAHSSHGHFLLCSRFSPSLSLSRAHPATSAPARACRSGRKLDHLHPLCPRRAAVPVSKQVRMLSHSRCRGGRPTSPGRAAQFPVYIGSTTATAMGYCDGRPSGSEETKLKANGACATSHHLGPSHALLSARFFFFILCWMI